MNASNRLNSIDCLNQNNSHWYNDDMRRQGEHYGHNSHYRPTYSNSRISEDVFFNGVGSGDKRSQRPELNRNMIFPPNYSTQSHTDYQVNEFNGFNNGFGQYNNYSNQKGHQVNMAGRYPDCDFDYNTDQTNNRIMNRSQMAKANVKGCTNPWAEPFYGESHTNDSNMRMSDGIDKMISDDIRNLSHQNNNDFGRGNQFEDQHGLNIKHTLMKLSNSLKNEVLLKQQTINKTKASVYKPFEGLQNYRKNSELKNVEEDSTDTNQ